jgi:hypothetical protein
MAIRWNVGLVCGLVCLAGCSVERTYRPPPPPNFRCKEVPFQDTPAFDGLLESYLTNREPAVCIVLDTPAPDWPPRLVAWMKAYQAGGKVRAPAGKGGLDALLWLATGGQTPTESRLLLENLLDRLDRAAVSAAAWWADEAERRRRIDLLRPYLLDAERDPGHNGNYVIVLYNGHYD